MFMDSWEGVRRVLAVRLDNIGDLVMLGPALRALKHNLPQAEITILASPAGSQVAPLLPWVKDVIVWRASWQDVSGSLPQDPERELALVKELRNRQFDAAFIFTSFTQSPYPPAYVCYLAGIPLRVGHSGEFGGSLLTHWFKPPGLEGHQAERNLALLEKLGFQVPDRHLELHVPPVDEVHVEHLLAEAGISPSAPFIVLAPGASCAARRYDPQRFAAVARILPDQSGLPAVIVGSEREAEIIRPVIEERTPGLITSLVGKTSIGELAGIIRRASLVVANNSASLHIADAFSAPMVILYSGTEHESQWMPRRSPARLVRRETECSPCFAFNCPFEMECLDISPKEVVQVALQLLGEVFPRADFSKNYSF